MQTSALCAHASRTLSSRCLVRQGDSRFSARVQTPKGVASRLEVPRLSPFTSTDVGEGVCAIDVLRFLRPNGILFGTSETMRRLLEAELYAKSSPNNQTYTEENQVATLAIAIVYRRADGLRVS